jgi:opacity protein-like surface antigen
LLWGRSQNLNPPQAVGHQILSTVELKSARQMFTSAGISLVAHSLLQGRLWELLISRCVKQVDIDSNRDRSNHGGVIVNQRVLMPGAILLVVIASFVVGGCGAYRMGNPSVPAFRDKEVEPCGDLSTWGRKTIRDLYESQQYDSAIAAQEYWTDQCGANATTRRTGLLMHMAAGSFSDDLYGGWLIDNLLNYESGGGQYNYWGWRRGDDDRTFEEFNRRVALDLRDKMPDGSIARLLCECFTGDCDSVFVKLQEPRYRNTKLGLLYDIEIKRILKDRKEANFALYGGSWSPSGSEKSLGTHPILGMVMGGQGNRMLYNCVAEWRMGDASELYIVDHDGLVDTTKQFDGYYVGFEVGKEFYRSLRHQMFLRVGAGLDGFAYDASKDDGPREKINSYSVNFGLGYRYYMGVNSLNYVGVEGVYNLVGYQDDGGPDLPSKTIGVRLLVGWSGNEIFNRKLRDMHYGE